MAASKAAAENHAASEQLKKLPGLKRLFDQESEALFGDIQNDALRKKAQDMGYSTHLICGPFVQQHCSAMCLKATFRWLCVHAGMSSLMYPELALVGRTDIPQDLLQLGVQSRKVLELGRKVSKLEELKAKQAGSNSAISLLARTRLSLAIKCHFVVSSGGLHLPFLCPGRIPAWLLIGTGRSAARALWLFPGKQAPKSCQKCSAPHTKGLYCLPCAGVRRWYGSSCMPTE